MPETALIFDPFFNWFTFDFTFKYEFTFTVEVHHAVLVFV